MPWSDAIRDAYNDHSSVVRSVLLLDLAMDYAVFRLDVVHRVLRGLQVGERYRCRFLNSPNGSQRDGNNEVYERRNNSSSDGHYALANAYNF